MKMGGGGEPALVKEENNLMYNFASVLNDAKLMLHKFKSIVGILCFQMSFLVLGNQKSIW